MHVSFFLFQNRLQAIRCDLVQPEKDSLKTYSSLQTRGQGSDEKIEQRTLGAGEGGAQGRREGGAEEGGREARPEAGGEGDEGREGEGDDEDREEVHCEEAVEGSQERALLPPEDAEAGAQADVPAQGDREEPAAGQVTAERLLRVLSSGGEELQQNPAYCCRALVLTQ